MDVSPRLLELALTHRSYAYEHGGIPHNERLEFLGDSILGQAVTVMLYLENPDLDEGELAKRRASLVSSVALAEVATRIGLGEHLLLGRGEELTGGRAKSSILADTVEAIISLVPRRRGGRDRSRAAPHRTAPRGPRALRRRDGPEDRAPGERRAPGPACPVYDVSDSGPDHSKRFHAVVTVGDAVGTTGEGSSKKQAEMAAALEAWTRLEARTTA